MHQALIGLSTEIAVGSWDFPLWNDQHSARKLASLLWLLHGTVNPATSPEPRAVHEDSLAGWVPASNEVQDNRAAAKTSTPCSILLPNNSKQDGVWIGGWRHH